jgi:hypothetical protein
MMKGSMVAREIVLEDKRVCVPTPMIQEPFFELPVLVAPTVSETVVPTPVVSSPMMIVNNDEEPIQTDATDEGEQQQPQTEDVQNLEAPRRSQRVRRSAIPDDYEVHNTEEF